jgi:hypothetical protein
MKTKLLFTAIAFLLSLNNCFSQPGNGGMKPPSIEERLKMVDKEICQPLKLDKTQKEKVSEAFNDFFVAMDKIATPPAMPEKAKIDALAKIRDEKVKKAIPESLFTKYLELEKSTRPKGPEEHRR